MLAIPMWLEIYCTKKGRDGESVVSFRYSPQSRIWWWHDWENDDCARAYGIHRIYEPSDLLIAERQIVEMYDTMELENDDHFMDYVWCRCDGAQTRSRWREYRPYYDDDRLPWEIPVSELEYCRNIDTSVFLYGDRYSSCVVDIHHISPVSFKFFGIVMEPGKLVWRHATGHPCEKTEEGKPIYFIKVTQWVFSDERFSPCINPYPIQTTFTRELRNDEVLKEDMTDDEKNHTALSIILRPDPASQPLR